MIKMYIGLHVKYPLFLSDFTLEFSRQFFEKYSNIKFHETRPVGAELFNVDRWTDGHMTRLLVAFRNFGNAPKKCLYIHYKNVSTSTTKMSLHPLQKCLYIHYKNASTSTTKCLYVRYKNASTSATKMPLHPL